MGFLGQEIERAVSASGPATGQHVDGTVNDVVQIRQHRVGDAVAPSNGRDGRVEEARYRDPFRPALILEVYGDKSTGRPLGHEPGQQFPQSAA